MSKNYSGHRERLRERFLAGDPGAHTEETLVELMLTYSIPLKDVQPLAKKLVARFGGISGLLAADYQELCKIDGIKSYSAILIKLVEWIRTQYPAMDMARTCKNTRDVNQGTLFGPASIPNLVSPSRKESKTKPSKKTSVQESKMFSITVLKEAIELLPKLPDTEDTEEIKKYLRDNLRFSAIRTRKDYAAYIVKRMFSNGIADEAMRLFARKFAGNSALADVCYYRFNKAEPVMIEIVSEFLLPSLITCRFSRSKLREYLKLKYPLSHALTDNTRRVIEVLSAGGIIKNGGEDYSFGYRDVPIPAFAFILHSEFPEPGMYDFSLISSNQVITAMLWNPDSILPALYELRNLGIISKISEIDNVRQFTTKWSLLEVVKHLITSDKLA